MNQNWIIENLNSAFSTLARYYIWQLVHHSTFVCDDSYCVYQCQQQKRLALVMQPICTPDIRVSELRFITVETVTVKRPKSATKVSTGRCFCRTNCGKY